MKKILLFSVIIILFSVFSVGVYANNDLTTTHIDTTAIADNENKLVVVEIDVASETPFCGCSFNITYNNDVLEFVELTSGEVVENSIIITNEKFSENSIYMASVSMDVLPQNGNIATILFSYKTASTKEIDFEIVNCKVVDINSEKIECEINNASVTINKKDKKPSSDEIISIIPSSKDDNEKDITEDLTEDAIDEETESEKNDTNLNEDGHKDTSNVETDKSEETTDSMGNDASDSTDGNYEVFLMSFVDVEETDWFYNSVKYVHARKLMNGVSVTEFAPNATLTRAMLVTILYRMENEPLCGDPLFEDVEKNMWYTNSIAWASENNIVKGFGEGLFDPNANITREQIAVILYNYTNFKNQTTDNKAAIDKYVDNASVSAWAKEAIEWAVGSEIISGKGNGVLDPKGNATRAEIATIFMRYTKKYNPN